MNCPKEGCSAWSEVVYTRKAKNFVTRRRICGNNHRFTTLEVHEKDLSKALGLTARALRLTISSLRGLSNFISQRKEQNDQNSNPQERT